MSHPVFLCYSTKDKETAEIVCKAIEEAHIQVWMAPRDILSGKSWSISVLDAIHTCSLMVLILTEKSSKSALVNALIERATFKGVIICRSELRT